MTNRIWRTRRRRPHQGHPWVRAALAAGFGLIHGAGFANFLREMFPGAPAWPLVGFNLGIEAGQIAVLSLALVMFTGLDRAARLVAPVGVLRLRAVGTSLFAAGWATIMAVQRVPW